MKKILPFFIVAFMLLSTLPVSAITIPRIDTISNKTVPLKNMRVPKTKKYTPQLPLRYDLTNLPKPVIDPCKNIYVLKGIWEIKGDGTTLIANVEVSPKENTCELRYSDSDGLKFSTVGTNLPLIVSGVDFGGMNNLTIKIGYNTQKQKLSLEFSFGGLFYLYKV